MIDFADKNALVTGATGAIGRATARVFHQLGASLVLTDLDADGLSAFAEELDPQRRRTVTLRQDASAAEDAEAALKRAAEAVGPLDYLVTAAGLLRRQSLAEMTDDQVDQMLGVNFYGVFYTCRAACRMMRSGGAIVNVVSLAAHTGRERGAHYASAKGAVLAFTKSLAAELAPEIRVNAVSPGFIDTPLATPVLADQDKQFVEQIPLKRLGETAEVARAIAFLCSDWSTYITGQTLHVNGGLYING